MLTLGGQGQDLHLFPSPAWFSHTTSAASIHPLISLDMVSLSGFYEC
jgi:hypothetical protein